MFFMVPSVEYLGHHISSEGICPTEDIKRTIMEAPVPQNVSQLRSFLGLINFYGKFLQNLADTLAPLYKLLQKQEEWQWGPSQENAFKKAKAQLNSPCLLAHFDPGKRLILSCNAYPFQGRREPARAPGQNIIWGPLEQPQTFNKIK